MARARLTCGNVLLAAFLSFPCSAEELSVPETDETPLLQLSPAHSASEAESAKRRQWPPKMPVNGPGAPLRKLPDSVATTVDVHVTTVVIPGNIIIGENVSAGSGNSLNLTQSLKQMLADASSAASATASDAAAQSVEKINKAKVELPRFVTDGKKIWLQTEDGKHLLPPTSDCSMCGCFYNEDASVSESAGYDTVTQEELDAMPDGDKFTCEKYMPSLTLLEKSGRLLTRTPHRKA